MLELGEHPRPVATPCSDALSHPVPFPATARQPAPCTTPWCALPSRLCLLRHHHAVTEAKSTKTVRCTKPPGSFSGRAAGSGGTGPLASPAVALPSLPSPLVLVWGGKTRGAVPSLQADSIERTLTFTKKPFLLWFYLGLEIFHLTSITQTLLWSPCLLLGVVHLPSISTFDFSGSSSRQWDVACIRHRV